MNVCDIMVIDLLTIPDDAVLAEAVERMDANEIRHLPVLRRHALVGVLSDRDLLEHTGKLVSRVGEEGELDAPLVREVMQPMPLTIPPDATLSAAAEHLARWGIGCLPVILRDALVGQITATDLLDAFASAARQGELQTEDDPPVSTRMTTDVLTVPPDAPLGEAVRRMQDADVRHLLVTEPDATDPFARYGELVAIVSDRDVRRALGKGASLDTPVIEVGARLPITASPHEALSRAARRMSDRRFSALPVLDADERLVGILTVTDVLAHCARALERQDVSRAPRGAASTRRRRRCR